MNTNRFMEQESSSERDTYLDDMFRAYRDACPDPDPSPNFMPAIWARIEAREGSRNWFGHVAKALVTAALAASVILGMMISGSNQPNSFFDATFVDALRADHVATLEPLQLERITVLETQ
jgi:hypothetical protein